MSSNEPDKIFFAVNDLGVPIEKRHLEVGDYVWGKPPLVVERKEFNDLLRSLTDGRLFNQAFNMMGGEGRFLVVTGEVPVVRYIGRSKPVKLTHRDIQARKKKLFDLSVRLRSSFGISVFWVPDERDFPLWLVSAYEQWGRKSTGDRFIQKKEKTLNDIKLDIVTRIPGIGNKTGRLLLKEFSTIQNLSSVTKEEIQKKKIEGVGPKLSERIEEVLRT